METTFWSDFTIADHFGIEAVKDTYKRGLDYALLGVHYYAELALVLNHKIWEHYKQNNLALAKLYDELWREVDGKAYDFFTNEKEQHIYFQMTD